MANLFGELRTSIVRSELKPKIKLIDQTWRECAVLFPFQLEGVSIWRGLIVPIHIFAQMKKNLIKYPIQFAELGKNIEYLDEENKQQILYGWGKHPSRIQKEWLTLNYDVRSVDEDTNLIYEHDDIRLCTIQRLTSDQRLGILTLYNRNYQFYFLELCSNHYTDLIKRSGLKNFDRIISINGINIQEKTPLELIRLSRRQRHLPVQLLVCNPATYEHYKLTQMPIHEHLSTVQYCKPVFYTKSNSIENINDKNFYIIYLEENESICILSKSSIFKESGYIHVNDICFVEINEQYKRGQIIFIGSENECENMKITFENNHNLKTKFLSIVQCNDDNDKNWNIEQLPNELFFYVFQYLDASNLYNIFWGLNIHLNNLLQSQTKLSLIFNENTNLSMIHLYASQIISLIIQTSISIDFNQFKNLHALTLYKSNNEYLQQIQSSILPNLTHLAFFLELKFIMPSEILDRIFTGQFPLLRCVNLCQVNTLTLPSLAICYSLQLVSLFTNQPIIIASTILTTCPNLRHLRLLVLPNTQIFLFKPKLKSNHPLKRLTLWTDNAYLIPSIVETFFEYTPNIEHLYLQFPCNIPFIQFASEFIKQLQYLSKFECYINEIININDRKGNVSDIHRLHPTFQNIQCIFQNETHRIFATK